MTAKEQGFNKIKLIYIAIFTLIDCALFAQGTLYNVNGEKMRGAPMMLAKHLPQSVNFATDINNWYYLQSQGINTIRLCWVDPWYRDNGFQHWSAAEVRPYIDQCVQNANETGMNLIINCHHIDEQGQSNLYYNFSPVNEFWGEIAWRYANNPLVYYEIVNEPTFVSDDYYHPNFKRNRQKRSAKYKLDFDDVDARRCRSKQLSLALQLGRSVPQRQEIFR